MTDVGAGPVSARSFDRPEVATGTCRHARARAHARTLPERPGATNVAAERRAPAANIRGKMIVHRLMDRHDGPSDSRPHRFGSDLALRHGADARAVRARRYRSTTTCASHRLDPCDRSSRPAPGCSRSINASMIEPARPARRRRSVRSGPGYPPVEGFISNTILILGRLASPRRPRTSPPAVGDGKSSWTSSSSVRYEVTMATRPCPSRRSSGRYLAVFLFAARRRPHQQARRPAAEHFRRATPAWVQDVRGVHVYNYHRALFNQTCDARWTRT